MTDTPRTDAAAFIAGTYRTQEGMYAYMVVSDEICRDIERELATVTKECETAVASLLRMAEDRDSWADKCAAVTAERDALRIAMDRLLADIQAATAGKGEG